MRKRKWRNIQYVNFAAALLQSVKTAFCTEWTHDVSQAKAEKEFQGEPEQPIDAEEAEQVSKEADSRSVYVGNVDYDCTPEELQRHFQVNHPFDCV